MGLKNGVVRKTTLVGGFDAGGIRDFDLLLLEFTDSTIQKSELLEGRLGRLIIF